MDDSAPALGLDRQIDTLAREGALLAATVRRDPGGRLRSCPDWTSGDLFAHVSAFVRYAHGLVTGGPAGRELPTVTAADADATWDDDLARLADVLRTTPPDAPAPNWAVSPDTAAFWQRRLLAASRRPRDHRPPLGRRDRTRHPALPHRR